MRRQYTTVVAVLAGALFALVPTLAGAATIMPDTRHDDATSNGNCTLREAVISANTDSARDGCRAGDGSDVIVLKSRNYRLQVLGTAEDAGLTGDLDVFGVLHIQGPHTGATIKANGIDRALDAHGPGGLALSHIHVKGGDTPGAESGGGLRLSGANPQALILRSTFTGNTAGATGGGIFAEDPDPSGTSANVFAVNTTIADNTAETTTANGGGGIQALGGSTSVWLIATTVTDNTAQFGGGTHSADGAEVELTGTVLAGNTATEDTGPDCGGPDGVVSGPGQPNLVGDTFGCAITDEKPADITGEDPLLLPLADNGGPVPTSALEPGSPAVNQGLGTAPGGLFQVGVDARGIPRPEGDPTELGAYELAYCRGEPVNRVGADKLLEERSDDSLKGTNADDGFLTFGGRDIARGKRRHDVFCLGGGRDRGVGGAGKDQIDGEGGHDILKGGKGRDILRGGRGRDTMIGGPGFDICRGGPGRDTKIGCEA